MQTENKSVLILLYRKDQMRWAADEHVTWAEYVRRAESWKGEGVTWKAQIA